MRVSTLACVALCLVALNLSTAAAAEESSRAEFKAAYGAYQELLAKGDHNGALPFAQRAYELGMQIYGEEDKNAGALAVNYGKLLLLTDKPEEAKPVLEKAVQIYENVYGKDSPELIDPLMELGHASAEFGDIQPQKRHYSKALALAKRRDGEDSILYGRLLLEAGAQILERASSPMGLPYMTEALEIFEKHGETAAQWRGMAQFYIGKHYLALRKMEAAEEHFLKALESFKDPDRPSGQMELATHAFLVEAYQRQKKYDMATNHCQAIGRMTPFTNTQDYMPLFRRSPEYPQTALETGREGWAQIEFTVDETGSIRDPRAVDVEGGERFATAALAAIRDWRYAPRFVDGKPVATEKVQTVIKFEIAP